MLQASIPIHIWKHLKNTATYKEKLRVGPMSSTVQTYPRVGNSTSNGWWPILRYTDIKKKYGFSLAVEWEYQLSKDIYQWERLGLSKSTIQLPNQPFCSSWIWYGCKLTPHLCTRLNQRWQNDTYSTDDLYHSAITTVSKFFKQWQLLHLQPITFSIYSKLKDWVHVLQPCTEAKSMNRYKDTLASWSNRLWYYTS